MNAPTLRRRLSETRSTLQDIASDLDGMCISADLAAVEISLAAELVRKGMSSLTDALTHRLPGDGR